MGPGSNFHPLQRQPLHRRGGTDSPALASCPLPPPASPDPFLCMTLPLSAPPREELNLAVLHAFVDLHEFTDLNLVQALR